MKKLITSLIAVAGLAYAANATVLLNEPFTYPDGNLSVGAGTNIADAFWHSHSGAGNGPVQVTSGKAVLVTANAEDVNRVITPGTGYGATTLYGSFKVNFSVLPTGAGVYFAHFSQNSSTFRCKMFSTITNATSGKFRLGVANSANTPIYIGSDLSLNQEYKLVFRLAGGTNATLWINPTSEASVVNRADGTDATTLGTYASTNYSFRQSTGMGTMTLDDLLIGTQFSDVQTIGGPPSISGLVATSIAANSNTGPLPFLISDVETPAASLTVAATSANPTLVPNSPANLTFGGSGGNRTLTVTPAAGQQGTANIDAVVTDGDGFTSTNSFLLTVGSPAISAIANQTVAAAGAISVPLWVNDAETAPGALTVTATSSDQTVLPDANISIVNPGTTNRSLSLTSAAAGFATVTVTVSDGTFSIPTTFVLTAYPDEGLLLGDDFSYADGSVVDNSASDSPYPWLNNTGTASQLQVAGGKLMMVNTNSEDIQRWFTNAPIPKTSGMLIHSRFVINLSGLPTANSTGEYFAHIYAYSGAYRGRIFATTNGAATGKYRMTISNGGYVTTAFPQDFDLNEPHVIITRFNTATCETTLWVDPLSESSAHVTATDSAPPADNYYGFSFRQATSGTMSVDDLLVGSTFSQVLLIVPSANANLSALALSGGTLAPAFAAGTLSYTAGVPNATASITVTPTTANAGATIQAQVNGGGFASVTSGSPSSALALNTGANTVDVKVTAQDTTTVKTYTVTVTRAVAPTPEPIVPSKSADGQLVLSWNQAAFTLTSSTNVTGPYLPVPGATSPYTNIPSSGMLFYRLEY